MIDEIADTLNGLFYCLALDFYRDCGYLWSKLRCHKKRIRKSS